MRIFKATRPYVICVELHSLSFSINIDDNQIQGGTGIGLWKSVVTAPHLYFLNKSTNWITEFYIVIHHYGLLENVRTCRFRYKALSDGSGVTLPLYQEYNYVVMKNLKILSQLRWRSFSSNRQFPKRMRGVEDLR